jgi:hypothetical protein
MDYKTVVLYKADFTYEDWYRLSIEFGFDVSNVYAEIHVVVD